MDSSQCLGLSMGNCRDSYNEHSMGPNSKPKKAAKPKKKSVKKEASQKIKELLERLDPSRIKNKPMRDLVKLLKSVEDPGTLTPETTQTSQKRKKYGEHSRYSEHRDYGDYGDFPTHVDTVERRRYSDHSDYCD